MTTFATDATTQTLLSHMRAAEQEVTREHGPFHLFGLFEREDTPGRWDVVVSAGWLPPGRDGIFLVAQSLSRHLTQEELILVARIVPLPPDSSFVRMVNDSASVVSAGFVRVPRSLLGTAEISQGYLLASMANPIPPPISTRG